MSGYSVKYCTYVMMDMDTQKVIGFDTLSVYESTSSNAMETKGCDRLLKEFKTNHVNISVLCTDRHAGIARMTREEFPEIEHQFDLWHLIKSSSKRLMAAEGMLGTGTVDPVHQESFMVGSGLLQWKYH